MVEGVTAKEAAQILGVTEGAIYLRKKKLGAYRTPHGWMFDRSLIEAERAAKANAPLPRSAADAENVARVFVELDAGLAATEIVKKLVLVPEFVKQAIVAYHDLRGQVLLSGIHLERLSRMGIGIGPMSSAETIVSMMEAAAASVQPCVSCRSRPPSVCATCARPSSPARRAR